MSLTDPTANAVLLYSVLVKDSYGATASRIIEHLCTRETCPLAELGTQLGLRTRELIRELQPLLRNQLVIAESVSSVVFRVHTENLERLTRHGHYIRLVEHGLRIKFASSVIRLLLIFGTLRCFDILALCFDDLEREDEQRFADGSNAEISKTERDRELNKQKCEVLRQLATLCELKIVRANAIESSMTSTNATSTRLVSSSDSIRYIINGVQSNVNAFLREVENARRSKAKSPENGFLELDYETLDQLAINELCIDAVRARFDDFSAELVRAMLSESRWRRIASNTTATATSTSTAAPSRCREIDTSYPLDLVWMRIEDFASSRTRKDNDQSTRVDWSTVSDDVKRAHLDAMAADSAGFIESESIGALSNSQTRYTVRVQKIIGRLADSAVERVIEQRDGARTARVFRCVRTLDYADLKDIETTCLLSAKEAKEITFKLLADHFIRLTELSRSGNFVSSQSQFLLRVEPLTVVRRIIELAARTMHNLMAKRALIFDENNALLEIETRITADLAALQGEYRDALRKIRERPAGGEQHEEGDADGDGDGEGEGEMTVEELDAIQAERSAEIRARLCDADRVRLESAKRAIAMLRSAEAHVSEQLLLLVTYARMTVAAQRNALRSSRAAGSTRRRTAVAASADIVQQLAAASTSGSANKRKSVATKHDDEAASGIDSKRRRKV